MLGGDRQAFSPALSAEVAGNQHREEEHTLHLIVQWQHIDLVGLCLTLLSCYMRFFFFFFPSAPPEGAFLIIYPIRVLAIITEM